LSIIDIRPGRAEAERKVIADVQKIVAIWNAKAGGRALWFDPTIAAATRRAALVELLLPGMWSGRIG
jgi:hypothetical protein